MLPHTKDWLPSALKNSTIPCNMKGYFNIICFVTVFVFAPMLGHMMCFPNSASIVHKFSSQGFSKFCFSCAQIFIKPLCWTFPKSSNSNVIYQLTLFKGCKKKRTILLKCSSLCGLVHKSKLKVRSKLLKFWRSVTQGWTSSRFGRSNCRNSCTSPPPGQGYSNLRTILGMTRMYKG